LPRHRPPPSPNNPEYDDDYTIETSTSAAVEPAAGKQVVDAAEWFVRPELSHNNGAFLARLDANVTDERGAESFRDSCHRCI
jgi:hypothetical protein